jgi:7-keto-8-aminopelargonate synthetase-like enzyme
MKDKANGIVLEGSVGPEVSIDGKRFLYFGGTNYLSMAGREELRQGAIRALEQFGVSSSAARSSSGTLSIHLELENKVAEFAGTGAAVNYSSGYLGMAILLSGLLEPGDTVAVHRDAHSSIRDAVRAWAPGYVEFELDDLESLAVELKKISGDSRVVVACEGVSPLFGRVLPLPELLAMLAGREHLVLIDDAHGFGVLGDRGRGTASHFAVESERVISCATLSKAFGSFSGVVPVTAGLAERIRERSVVYQCSSPPPAPICGAAISAFDYLGAHPELFEVLRANNRLLRTTLSALGLDVPDLPTPIVPLTDCGGPSPEQLNRHLLNNGILAPFTHYPGSPQGGMVRLAVTAGHTAAQIERLGEEIGKLLG